MNAVISLFLLFLAIPFVLLAIGIGWIIKLIQLFMPIKKIVVKAEPEYRPGHKASACDVCTPHGHA